MFWEKATTKQGWCARFKPSLHKDGEITTVQKRKFAVLIHPCVMGNANTFWENQGNALDFINFCIKQTYCQKLIPRIQNPEKLMIWIGGKNHENHGQQTWKNRENSILNGISNTSWRICHYRSKSFRVTNKKSIHFPACCVFFSLKNQQKIQENTVGLTWAEIIADANKKRISYALWLDTSSAACRLMNFA